MSNWRRVVRTLRHIQTNPAICSKCIKMDPRQTVSQLRFPVGLPLAVPFDNSVSCVVARKTTCQSLSSNEWYEHVNGKLIRYWISIQPNGYWGFRAIKQLRMDFAWCIFVVCTMPFREVRKFTSVAGMSFVLGLASIFDWGWRNWEEWY